MDDQEYDEKVRMAEEAVAMLRAVNSIAEFYIKRYHRPFFPDIATYFQAEQMRQVGQDEVESSSEESVDDDTKKAARLDLDLFMTWMLVNDYSVDPATADEYWQEIWDGTRDYVVGFVKDDESADDVA